MADAAAAAGAGVAPAASPHQPRGETEEGGSPLRRPQGSLPRLPTPGRGGGGAASATTTTSAASAAAAAAAASPGTPGAASTPITPRDNVALPGAGRSLSRKSSTTRNTIAGAAGAGGQQQKQQPPPQSHRHLASPMQSNVKLQILSTFGLDQSEILLDEYKCYYLMANMVPLQGRLYITQYHVCFYSNLLNVEHKLVFRARDITRIQRRDERAVSLELRPSASGSRPKQTEEQFTFANRRVRDEACDYLECLEISRTPVVLPAVSSVDDSESFDASTVLADPMAPASTAGGSRPPSGDAGSGDGNVSSAGDDSAAAAAAKAAGGGGDGGGGVGGGHDDDDDDTHGSGSEGTGDEGDDSSDGEDGDAPGVPIVGCSPLSPPGGQAITATIPSALAADLDSLPVMAEATFTGATVEHIFGTFFSDECAFGVKEYGAMTQEFKHTLAPWQACGMVGGGSGYCLTRVIRNKRKIPKNPISPSDHVDVTSTHHILAFGDAACPGLYFRCSALSEGVLYSNHFTTETRWVFRQTGPTTVTVAMHGDLLFTKSVNFMIKPIIVKTTRANITQTLEVWNREVPRVLRENPLPAAAPAKKKKKPKKKKKKKKSKHDEGALGRRGSGGAGARLSAEVEAKLGQLTAQVAAVEAQLRRAEEAAQAAPEPWHAQLAQLPWTAVAQGLFVLFAVVFLHRIDAEVTALRAYLLGMQHGVGGGYGGGYGGGFGGRFGSGYGGGCQGGYDPAATAAAPPPPTPPPAL